MQHRWGHPAHLAQLTSSPPTPAAKPRPPATLPLAAPPTQAAGPRPPDPLCTAHNARPAHPGRQAPPTCHAPSCRPAHPGRCAPPTRLGPPTPPPQVGQPRPAPRPRPRRLRWGRPAGPARPAGVGPRLLSSSRSSRGGGGGAASFDTWAPGDARGLSKAPGCGGGRLSRAPQPRPRAPTAQGRAATRPGRARPPGGCSHVEGAGGGEPAHREHLPGTRAREGGRGAGSRGPPWFGVRG